MNTLYIMCGIPGSGKSTLAKTFLTAETVSSDDIREELFGNASIQSNPRLVFQKVDEKVRAILNSGKDAIYDATGIKANLRKNIIKKFPNVRHICLFVNTPLETCLSRNSKRERIVPEYVIKRMYSQLEIPSLEEGFDEIKIYS